MTNCILTIWTIDYFCSLVAILPDGCCSLKVNVKTKTSSELGHMITDSYMIGPEPEYSVLIGAVIFWHKLFLLKWKILLSRTPSDCTRFALWRFRCHSLGVNTILAKKPSHIIQAILTIWQWWMLWNMISGGIIWLKW